MGKNRLFSLGAFGLLVCLLGAAPVRAQVLYGSILGSLQDPSGSAVPNASVTITNKQTGQTREAVSDAQGNFKLVNPRFCEMLGYREEALLRLNAADTYAEEDKALLRETGRRVLAEWQAELVGQSV